MFNAGDDARRIGLHLIKSLYEVQNSDIMKVAARNVSGGGDVGFSLTFIQRIFSQLTAPHCFNF